MGGTNIKLNILKVDWKQDKVALMPMSQKQVVCLAQGGLRSGVCGESVI